MKPENKKIAKNTLALYIRQFATLCLALYTSRLTLKILGVTDFGIYAAVGGVTSLLSILNTSLSASSQRFLTYEIGTGDNRNVNKVFNSCLHIHLIFSVLFLILAETLGLWFIFHKLFIPANRLEIAIWVYQFSVITCILSLISVPYYSLIISHEDMNVTAFFSILDALLKLGSILILTMVSYDRLFFYSVLLCLIQFLDRIFQTYYCKFKYDETHFSFKFDKDRTKKILNLAGWNIFSSLSFVGFTQGINVLLNIFFGPVLNAAYTVAMQAYSGVRSFCSGFQLASNPQIIKLYSNKQLEDMHRLLFTVCKISLFMLYIISFPFLVNAEYILKLWLGVVPLHAISFFRLLLLFSYIDVCAYPLDISAQAHGKIRNYSLCTSTLMIIVLPIGYCLFKGGMAPESIYFVSIVLILVGLVVRLFFLKKMIVLPLRQFVQKVLLKGYSTIVLGSIFPTIFHYYYYQNSFIVFICNFIICLICGALSVYFVGLDDTEKRMLQRQFSLMSKTKF